MLSEYHRVVTGTAVHMPVRQVFLFTVPLDHLNHVRIHLCGRQAMILAKPDLKALAFDGFQRTLQNHFILKQCLFAAIAHIDAQIHSICDDVLHPRKYLQHAIGQGGRRGLRHHLTGRLCDKFRSSHHRIVP